MINDGDNCFYLLYIRIAATFVLGSSAEFYDHGITNYFAVVGDFFGILVGSLLFVPTVYGLGYASVYTVCIILLNQMIYNYYSFYFLI